MRKYDSLTRYRTDKDFKILSDEFLSLNGCFTIPIGYSKCKIVADARDDWDHVNVVVKFGRDDSQYRIATKEEMIEIKEMFFEDSEPAIEIHPKKEDYVNIDEYMLHLWRPVNRVLPLPPVIEEELSPCDLIDIPDSNIALLARRGEKDGWTCYEISITRNGKRLFRYPTWYEMCEAKRVLVGDDEFAIQFHMPNRPDSKNTTSLWVPPKTIDFPLPEPYMVGARNLEDEIKQHKRTMELLKKYPPKIRLF